MPRWIALFRGINVGGKNTLSMQDLRTDLEALELQNVQTYIQSGNVVFDSPRRSAASIINAIAERIQTHHALQIQVFLLTPQELQQASEANPFTPADPKSLHYFFLQQQPRKPNLPELQRLQADDEEFHLGKHLFYLHSPAGIGRSKLAAKIEKLLGVVTTARNARTVEKLLQLAAS